MPTTRFFSKLFWAALAAAALFFQTCLLIGEAQSIENQLFFVFSATVFAYNFGNKNWWVHHVSWIFGGLAGVFFFKMNFGQQVFLAAPAVVFAAYYGLKMPGRAVGLRSKIWAKPFAVGLVWAAVTVVLPLTNRAGATLIHSGTHFSSQFLWMFLERWLFVSALALAYDLADIEHDRALGLETIAAKFGKKRALFGANILLAGSAIFVAINWSSKFYATATALALLFSLIVSGAAVWFLNEKKQPFYGYKNWVDFLMVMQAGLVFWGEKF